MNDEERLARLLRSALPAVLDEPPRRDLWSLLEQRDRHPLEWQWVDIGIAAAVSVTLLAFPALIWILIYHL